MKEKQYKPLQAKVAPALCTSTACTVNNTDFLQDALGNQAEIIHTWPTHVYINTHPTGTLAVAWPRNKVLHYIYGQSTTLASTVDKVPEYTIDYLDWPCVL